MFKRVATLATLAALLSIPASMSAQTVTAPGTTPTTPTTQNILGVVAHTTPTGHVGAMFHMRVPTTGDSWEMRARRFLDTHGAQFGVDANTELRLERVTTGNSGITFVRFHQWLHDRFVVSAEIVVWIAPSGDVIAVLGNLRPAAANLDSDAATTDLEAFQTLVALEQSEGVLMPKVSDAEIRRRMRLIYLPVAAGLRLVWGIDVPELHAGDGRVAFIDAQTNELVLLRDTAKKLDGANAWMPSPGEQGNAPTELVVLTGRDPNQEFLTGPLLRTFNCVNQGVTVETFGGNVVPICSETQLAAADMNGDFFYDPVDSTSTVVDMETGELAKDTDKFAEVHMFFHVMRGYEWFQTLGFTELRSKPFRAVVNERTPDYWGGGSELLPYDNAYYTPAGDFIGEEERTEDSIVFGQGTNADFSYDGDVIYHEFTHAVIDSTAGLEFATFDSIGFDTAPGAMHEGYADYFAAAFTEDSVIGDFVGPALDAQFAGNGLRDIGDDAICPNNLIGETHQDSLHFSAGLWNTRSTLLGMGMTAAQFDSMVFDSMQGLDPEANYTTAGRALEAVMRVANPAWADAAVPEMEATGVIGCERIIDLSEPGTVKDEMYTLGPRGVGFASAVPGPMQFKVTVPEGGDAIRFQYLAPTNFRGNPIEFVVPMRVNQPVRFTYSGAEALHDGNEFEWGTQIGVEVVQTTQGPWEIPRYEVVFEDLLPGDYYLAMMQNNSRQGQVYDISAEVLTLNPVMEEVADTAPDMATDVMDPGMTDAGVDMGMEGTAEGIDEESADEGCGCSQVRGDSSPLSSGLVALMLAGGLVFWRRRRT